MKEPKQKELYTQHGKRMLLAYITMVHGEPCLAYIKEGKAISYITLKELRALLNGYCSEYSSLTG